MHDFMQSLQIRWPVAATIGLSTQIIASAPIGQPSARSLWNSEIRSSSGQPASVHAERALLERDRRTRAARRASSRAARARTNPCPARGTRCSSAPGRGRPTRSVPRVGQREAFAAAQVLGRRSANSVDAVHRRRLDRHELHAVELARRAEQHAARVRGAALPACAPPTPRSAARRRARSRCAASSCCQRVTARAKASSSNTARRARASSSRAQRGAVERRSGVGLVRVHRLALDELALDGEERRELVVPRLQRAHLGLDAEQRRRGSPRDAAPSAISSVRLGLARERVRVARAAARRSASAASALREMRDEQRVDARRALRRVEVGEAKVRGRGVSIGSGRAA